MSSERFAVHVGDNLPILKTLADNSVDAIVTDPPAGISMMGKDWDSDKGGRDKWIDWMAEVAAECLRVIKPGGHALVWALPRTSHWTATAWENAGWEPRDRICHIFGCLSEDTEILTVDGWMPYHTNIEDRLVLCYDVNDNSFVFDKPKRSFIYDNEHSAYSIKSDYTDQLVSRNHRVIVERGGRRVFAYAETLQSQESVPFLESLRDLPSCIPNIYKGTSVKKQDLLKIVYRQADISKAVRGEDWRKGAASSRAVCFLRKAGSVATKAVEIQQEKLLQLFLSGKSACGTPYTVLRKWKRKKAAKHRLGGSVKSKLEGWSDVFSQAWKLLANQIRSMSKSFFGYGEEGWLRHGTQTCNGNVPWKVFDTARSGSSHKPQSAGQQASQSDAICKQSRTQVVRSTRAEIKEVEYVGRVWCVEVSTGAFVARRNGKIFITGNSGFPKSANISKHIDRMAGAEREVIRFERHGKTALGVMNDDAWQAQELVPYTAPATDAAKQWGGWGTTLKPAVEDYWLFRKPIEKGLNIAQNVLEWGTGGVNVDGCRVGIDSSDDIHAKNPHTENKGKNGGWCTSGSNGAGYSIPSGRFPANLIHDGSDEVVGLFPVTGPSKAVKGARAGKSAGRLGAFSGQAAVTMGHDDQGGSAARFFYCAKPGKSERDAGLEELPEQLHQSGIGGAMPIDDDGNERDRFTARSRNVHPTVKALKLMRYLCRLITPPNGLILDPFTGSGSTGCAAMIEGFRFIGMEQSPEYAEIATKRIEHWLQTSVKYEVDTDEPQLSILDVIDES